MGGPFLARCARPYSAVGRAGDALLGAEVSPPRTQWW